MRGRGGGAGAWAGAAARACARRQRRHRRRHSFLIRASGLGRTRRWCARGACFPRRRLAAFRPDGFGLALPQSRKLILRGRRARGSGHGGQGFGVGRFDFSLARRTS
eukprot:3764563-Alexandrium_andersonii.AAC.1